MKDPVKGPDMQTILLAYSGGLDTSVAIHWLKERYGCDVVAATVDVGQSDDLKDAMRRATAIGASRAWIVDARQEFVEKYLLPAIKANALYEGNYPLGTALARPLMAAKLVDLAKRLGADAIAHGCTGKGNDQVRFEVSIAALAPEMNVIAPARDWAMSRDEEIAYAEDRGIQVPVTSSSPYSIDESIWGRAIECGVIEDAWAEPPEDAYAWTKGASAAPEQAESIEIGFECGRPASLNGEELDLQTIILRLNETAGKHGVGRIDHIESRLVGIKSREVYEAPAATVLIKAHQDLESMVMTKDMLHSKRELEMQYADLVYNGLWFSQLREALDAFMEKTQENVTGKVRLRLFKGSVAVTGRASPFSLYRTALSTYDKRDEFDQSAAKGFVYVWGLPVRTCSIVKAMAEKAGLADEGAVKEGIVDICK
jgi:argininosuccinate synthase